jgi:DNA-binding MarR family transcriptional regulator
MYIMLSVNTLSGPLDDVSLCACSNLRAAARSLTRAYDRALEPSGLRLSQFTILSVLEAGAPNTVSELAHTLGMEQTTLTRNVQLLERDRLLASVADPEDTRVRRLSLAPEGRRRLRRAMPLWRAMQERIDGAVGEGGIEALVDSARRAWVAAG